MAPETLAAKQDRAKQIIAILTHTHPDAKLALDFANPLELLIALMLAAQCRDELVNQVTAEIFPRYRTAADWTQLRQEDIARISFFRKKTLAIQKTAGMLVNNFDGQVPGNLEDLLTLPGVGRKTANAVLANAFGVPAVAVDTHVGRVSYRLALTSQTKPDEVEAELVEVVSKKDWVKFCHLLQFHGRRVCTALRPNCPGCSVNQLCPKIGVK